MEDFIWTESPGTTVQKKPRVRSTRFGDGYEERAPDGLNPMSETWSLSFRGIDLEMADEIEAFLDARLSAIAGLEAFNYVPLWRTVAIRVVCREWTRSQDDDPNTCTINASFEREYVA